jgi:hypothetical protein
VALYEFGQVNIEEVVPLNDEDGVVDVVVVEV